MTDTPPNLTLVVNNNEAEAQPQGVFKPHPELALTPVQAATCVSVLLQNVDILHRAGLISTANYNQIIHSLPYSGPPATSGDNDPPLAS